MGAEGRGRARPDRSLVIPVYREAGRIDATLDALAGGPLDQPGTEIVVVDDGSDDDTVAVVRGAAMRTGVSVRVVRLGGHRGKGAAVRAGVLAARGDTIVFTDADLSTPVPDVVRCFEHVDSGTVDVSYATRAHEGSSVADRGAWYRALFGRTYNRLLRGLGLTTTLDTQCGLKGFRREAARGVFGALQTDGFAFDVEVLARADRAGLRVEPLAVQWTHVGASRVRPMRDATAMALDALRIRWALRSGRSAVVAPGEGGPGSDGAVDMDRADIEALAETEDDHWWFTAKRRLVAGLLEDLPRGASFVDVGAGGGALLADLDGQGWVALGTDASTVAARQSRRRSGATMLIADAGALPLRAGSMDAITSLDVVEHLDDDVAALAGYRALLRPGGRLIVTVPAYTWAWSDHDIRLGHRRRYTARRLRLALTTAGLTPTRVTYFHGWLVPLAAAVRKTPIGRLVGDQEAAGAGPSRAAPLLDALATVERRIVRSVGLPFGLSVLAVAERPARPDTQGPAVDEPPIEASRADRASAVST